MKTLEHRGSQATPEETRDRILRAAREVLSHKGKRGATTREIADVAGVNEATLFRHFGSKEHLIVAVAQHFCGVAELESALTQMPGTLEEDLFVLASTLFSHMEAARDMILWSLMESEDEAKLLANTTWRPQTALREVMTKYLAGRVASGDLRGDPTKLAIIFMSFIFSHVLAQKRFHLDEIYGGDERALRYYIDVFLKGVRSN